VTGHVADADGRPFAGVEVVAHCGEGTLHVTGKAVTDEHGDYTLRFGPGFHHLTFEPYAYIQAATISPQKTGYCERNLHRQGDLLMADRTPTADELRPWTRSQQRDGASRLNDVIVPDRPKRVDFVMVPAAKVRGRLVDAKGQPLPDTGISLTGDELPPSSSVVAWTKTDAQGGFAFGEVPVGRVWWFSARVGRENHASKKVKYDAPKDYSVEVVLDKRFTPALSVRPTR
jgi:hypothetical protein